MGLCIYYELLLFLSAKLIKFMYQQTSKTSVFYHFFLNLLCLFISIRSGTTDILQMSGFADGFSEERLFYLTTLTSPQTLSRQPYASASTSDSPSHVLICQWTLSLSHMAAAMATLGEIRIMHYKCVIATQAFFIRHAKSRRVLIVSDTVL